MTTGNYTPRITNTITLVPGFVLAVLLSYATNGSVAWCLAHALCGWCYVAYWLCAHSIVPQLIWAAVGS